MGTYFEIIQDLDNELSNIKNVSDNISDQMEYAIGHCKIALGRMRELVIKQGFPDKESEIDFFKKIKPTVYSRLLYYRAIFDLESKCQKADSSVIRRYLQKRLYKISEYMEERQEKVQYFKCGFKHLDEKYFLRDTKEIPLELRNNLHLMDEEFFTWHDHTFSTIMANEMLVDHIRSELDKLERKVKGKNELLKSPLYWTGKNIELAENLYALYFSGSVNHGKATIKDLTEFIGWALNIDLSKDIYRYFTEIQQRAEGNETKYLDFLKAVLLEKLEEKNK